MKEVCKFKNRVKREIRSINTLNIRCRWGITRDGCFFSPLKHPEVSGCLLDYSSVSARQILMFLRCCCCCLPCFQETAEICRCIVCILGCFFPRLYLAVIPNVPSPQSCVLPGTLTLHTRAGEHSLGRFYFC